jgi:ABC-type nickel/cobalt efflux system permease component RcnA
MNRFAAVTLLACAVVLGAIPAAGAHPLGNFTVNRYAGIAVAPGQVTVRYVIDLAEIPAFQELQRIDPEGDGPGAGELAAWAERTAAEVTSEAVVRIDDRPVPLEVGEAAAAVRPGQGGLSTLRLEAVLVAELSERSGTLTFIDRNDPGRLGWREITAAGVDGVVLAASTVPATSVTDALRSYPDDLSSSPLAVTSMEARFRPGGAATEPPPESGTHDGAPVAAPGASLASAVGREGAALMVLGVLVALAFGAWHALLPGHGKTLIAAALVGSAARVRQALAASVSVAAMHTASVVALGLAVVVLERAFAPEVVYPWLRVTSGLVAIGIGAGLVRRRWPSRWRSRGHPRGPRGEHDRQHDGEHAHLHEVPPGDLLSRRGIAALAVAGGILPSPSALLVLLAALQRGRAAYGLGLVLAFSIGMAASLVAVGLGATKARAVVEGRAWRSAASLVPLGSAAAILVVGLVAAGTGFASL